MACPVDSVAVVLGAPAFPVRASCPHPTTPAITTVPKSSAREYPYLFIVLSLKNQPVPFVHHSLHGEDHAEPRLAAHHAIVGGSGLFEREGLHHGPNPGDGTKVRSEERRVGKECRSRWSRYQ